MIPILSINHPQRLPQIHPLYSVVTSSNNNIYIYIYNQVQNILEKSNQAHGIQEKGLCEIEKGLKEYEIVVGRSLMVVTIANRRELRDEIITSGNEVGREKDGDKVPHGDRERERDFGLVVVVGELERGSDGDGDGDCDYDGKGGGGGEMDLGAFTETMVGLYSSFFMSRKMRRRLTHISRFFIIICLYLKLKLNKKLNKNQIKMILQVFSFRFYCCI